MATVDLFIAAGQSNMAGRGTASEAPITDPALAWEWDEDGTLPQLDDPGVAVSPYAAATGSPLPAFANAYVAESGRPAVFVRTAVGGTSLLAANATAQGGWHEGGTRFPDAVTRAQQAATDIAAAGHTIARTHVLWHQGERDAAGGADLASYDDALAALVGRFRSALSVPDLDVYVCRLGTTASEPAGWQTVRDAQDAACAATAGLEMVYTRCVDFYALGWMKADDLHYTQAGLNDMGATAGAAVAALHYGAPPPVVVGPRTGSIATRLRSILA